MARAKTRISGNCGTFGLPDDAGPQGSGVQRLKFHALPLTLIAAVYSGFALYKLAAGVGLELIGVVSFTLLALAGLWALPWFIVVGLVLHGGRTFYTITAGTSLKLKFRRGTFHFALVTTGF